MRYPIFAEDYQFYQHTLESAVNKWKKEKLKAKHGLIGDQQHAYQKHVEQTVNFFLNSENGRRLGRPIDRIVQTLALLGRPHFKEMRPNTYLQAVSKFGQMLILHVLEQQFHNPEQFVSHGFDHSMNVTDYMHEIVPNIPGFLESVCAKYNISKREARFTLEILGLLHDVGYPHLGHRCKSTHGFAGAMWIKETVNFFTTHLIRSQQADRDTLYKDFITEVALHSGDKTEGEYDIVAKTSTGPMLFNDVNALVRTLSDLNHMRVQHQTNRQTIDYTWARTKSKAMALKKNFDEREQYIRVYYTSGENIFLPGRAADLHVKGDRRFGIPFTYANLESNHLKIIRLVDNLDFDKFRTTPLQRHPAFKEIYFRLGDNTQLLGQLMEELRKIVKKFGKDPTNDEVIKEFEGYLQKIREDDSGSLPWSHNDLNQQIFNTPKDLHQYLVGKVVDDTLEKHFLNNSSTIADNIRRVALQLSSYDLRHFGGCEAILCVRVDVEQRSEESKKLVVRIVVNKERYDTLNNIRVHEGNDEIGVGEYQVYRLKTALKSIFFSSHEESNTDKVSCKNNKRDLGHLQARPISLCNLFLSSGGQHEEKSSRKTEEDSVKIEIEARQFGGMGQSSIP